MEDVNLLLIPIVECLEGGEVVLSVEKLIQKEIGLDVRLVLRNVKSAVISHTLRHAVLIIILLRRLREKSQLEFCKL